jgi:hypothetical protein
MALTTIDEYEVTYTADTFAPRSWLKTEGAFIVQLVFHLSALGLPAETQVDADLDDSH